MHSPRTAHGPPEGRSDRRVARRGPPGVAAAHAAARCDGANGDHPIRLDVRTIVNLGVFRSVRAGLSYLAAQAFPRRPERNLEDFLVNRFGRQLYETFFKSYTEKVWGVPCTGISAACYGAHTAGTDSTSN